MKRIVVSMVVLLGCAFGYLQINDIVGKVIDADEAKHYRIFSDVPGFESARFVENGDSVLVEINAEINGTHETQYRNIDTTTYASLDYYIKYFKRIIEDPEYRRHYIGEHAIGWPIVSQREIDSITLVLSDKRTLNTMNCMSGIASGSAYAGALLGRHITGSSGYCIPVYYYSIDPFIFGGITAAGTIAGCILSSNMDRNKIKDEVLKKDILAFDPYQQPITIQDYKKVETTTNQCIYGGGGVLVGLVASAATLAMLAAPWIFYEANSDWDAVMTVVPIVVFSVSELTAIVKLGSDLGQKEDLKATMEKIKQKRIKEHLEKIEKPDDR